MIRKLIFIFIGVFILLSCGSSKTKKASLFVEGDTTFVDGPAVLVAIPCFKQMAASSSDALYTMSPYEINATYQDYFKNDTLLVDALHTTYVGMKNENDSIFVTYNTKDFSTCFFAINKQGKLFEYEPLRADKAEVATFLNIKTSSAQ